MPTGERREPEVVSWLVMLVKGRVIHHSGFWGSCSGSDMLVSVQLQEPGTEPLSKLVCVGTSAGLLWRYLASWEVGHERRSQTPSVSAGQIPMASKDTGRLNSVHKGLSPKMDIPDSLELRTYTPHRSGVGEEIGTQPLPHEPREVHSQSGAGELLFQLLGHSQLCPHKNIKFTRKMFYTHTHTHTDKRPERYVPRGKRDCRGTQLEINMAPKAKVSGECWTLCFTFCDCSTL